MEFNELIESFAATLGVEGVEIEGGAAAFEIDGMKVDFSHEEAAGKKMSSSVSYCREHDRNFFEVVKHVPPKAS